MSEQQNKANTAIKQIEQLKKIYLQCRAVFPTLGKRLIGEKEYTTAPYYIAQGYNAAIELDKPITSEFIEENQKIATWINENAIIRLHGILNKSDYYEGSLDRTIPQWAEVDIVRQMRNVFTKTGLNYIPDKPENIKLRNNIIKHFNLNENEIGEGEIPTAIDTVVMPLFKACIGYVKACAKL